MHLQIAETRSRATTIVQIPQTKTRFTKSLHRFACYSEVTQSQNVIGTFLCAKACYYAMHVIHGLSVMCHFDRVLTRIIVFKLRTLIKFCGRNNISVNDQVIMVITIIYRCAYRKSLKVGTLKTFTAAIPKPEHKSLNATVRKQGANTNNKQGHAVQTQSD